MGVSIDLNMLMKEMFPMISVLSLACTLLHMTITLCNFHPFTFYLPFHTSPPVDQCPIHAPSTCTMGLDPCAQKVTVIFYSPLSALSQHLPSPFSVNVLNSEYLFQRGPIWVVSRYGREIDDN